MKTLLTVLGIILFAANARAQMQQFDSMYIFASSPSYDYRNISVEKPPQFMNITVLNSAYERHSAGRSDIITRKLFYFNLSAELALTNDAFMNINPSASRSIVAWQSNKFGSQDIFFSTASGSNWSAPIICDTSGATSETNPNVAENYSTGSPVYYIVYQKGSDIIVRTYSNGIKILDTNITASDNNPASSPVIKVSTSNLYIVYLTEVSPGHKNIVLKTANFSGSTLTWGLTNIIPQVSSPSNLKLMDHPTGLGIGFISYDYDTLGTKHTVGFSFTNSPNPSREILSKNFSGQNSGGEGAYYPILTDATVGYETFAWHRKTADSSIVFAFKNFSNGGNAVPKKRFYLGDSTVNTKITMTEPIRDVYWYRMRLIWEQRINGKWALVESIFDNALNGVVQTGNQVPYGFRLYQNYPNPFNPGTKIRFDIPRSSYVTLKVHDAAGRLITELLSQPLNAGTYEYNFNAENIPSGIYFYSVITESGMEMKKMVVLK